jgi:hypothetical protein
MRSAVEAMRERSVVSSRPAVGGGGCSVYEAGALVFYLAVYMVQCKVGYPGNALCAHNGCDSQEELSQLIQLYGLRRDGSTVNVHRPTASQLQQAFGLLASSPGGALPRAGLAASSSTRVRYYSATHPAAVHHCM